MPRFGVYVRMEGARRPGEPFRNGAQLELTPAGLFYSIRLMGGERSRRQVPMRWQDENGFTVDWSGINMHWSRAARFRVYNDNGVSGLLEQGTHVWRYAGEGGSDGERGRGSPEAGAPSSRPLGPRPPGATTPQGGMASAQSPAVASSSSDSANTPTLGSRPSGASTVDTHVERGRECYEAGAPNSSPPGSRPARASAPQGTLATAQSAAVPVSSPDPPNSRPVASRPSGDPTPAEVRATATSAPLASSSHSPAVYHTCLGRFDGTEYGAEYLSFKKGDVLERELETAASGGWAYGRVVLPGDRRSPAGWYPQTYVEEVGPRT